MLVQILSVIGHGTMKRLPKIKKCPISYVNDVPTYYTPAMKLR